jgi:hypothetical protein
VSQDEVGVEQRYALHAGWRYESQAPMAQSGAEEWVKATAGQGIRKQGIRPNTRWDRERVYEEVWKVWQARGKTHFEIRHERWHPTGFAVRAGWLYMLEEGNQEQEDEQRPAPRSAPGRQRMAPKPEPQEKEVAKWMNVVTSCGTSNQETRIRAGRGAIARRAAKVIAPRGVYLTELVEPCGPSRVNVYYLFGLFENRRLGRKMADAPAPRRGGRPAGNPNAAVMEVRGASLIQVGVAAAVGVAIAPAAAPLVAAGAAALAAPAAVALGPAIAPPGRGRNNSDSQ